MSADDVVVVGAGPVGLLAALGFARAGLRVTVLERGATLNDSPRAAVHHWCSLPLLDSLGILEDCLAAGVRASGLSFRKLATGETANMSLDVLKGVAAHPFNLHLGQGGLGQVVLEHLVRYPDVTVRWQTEFLGLEQDADSVRVRVVTPDGEEVLGADWVLGTDGARSAVRGALGLEFEGMTWGDRFVATNLRYDFERHGFLPANLVLDPQYGAIVAQLDNTGLWRCTFSEDESLPLIDLETRIAAFFAKFLPDSADYELVAYNPYRMHQRAATTFRVGRVLLAGDAAHATNPTGGMGLTSGLFDVEVLVEALPAVASGSAPEEVLDRYSRARRAAFLDIASPAATGFKQLVYDTSDPAVVDGFFAGLQAAASDPEAVRAQFLAIGQSRTRSVMTAEPASG